MKSYQEFISPVSKTPYVRKVTHIRWEQVKLRHPKERPSLDSLHTKYPYVPTFIKFASQYYAPSTIIAYLRRASRNRNSQQVRSGEGQNAQIVREMRT